MRWLITGGCGFIGSAFVRLLLDDGALQGRGLDTEVERVVVLDKLTYAGNRANLSSVACDPRLLFVHGDIADRGLVRELLAKERPDILCNFAAESHVDASIEAPEAFVRSNVVGADNLATEWLAFGGSRFLQVSTDEVYGSMAPSERASESSPLMPSNPYAASKAAAELLLRARARVHGLDLVITRSSNNYGPMQHIEKLVPKTITLATRNERIPIYGSGLQMRDWIWVYDNCEALIRAVLFGRGGATYNIGAGNERTNLEIIGELLRLCQRSDRHVAHVADRPGHDERYALDSSLAFSELGWHPRSCHEEGLERTVTWYRSNLSCWLPLFGCPDTGSRSGPFEPRDSHTALERTAHPAVVIGLGRS